MDDLQFWQLTLCVLVGVVLVPYVLIPVLIRFSFRQSAKPQLDTFEADHPSLPDDVAEHYHRVTEALRHLGFEVVQGLFLPNQAPKVKALVLMLANRTKKDAAIASVIYGDISPGRRLQTAYVEFVSRFRDGTLIQTNNSKELSAFPQRPGRTTTQFPTVVEADRLYRLHEALAGKYGSPSGKILRLDEEFQGDAVSYLSHALVEELASEISTGYLYLSQEEALYRATWKGAFLMTWGQLWPFKSIRRYRRRHRAQRLLAELEG